MNTFNTLVFLAMLLGAGYLNKKYRWLAPPPKTTIGLAQIVSDLKQVGHDVEERQRTYIAQTDMLLKGASLTDLRDLGEVLLAIQSKVTTFSETFRADTEALEETTKIPIGLPQREYVNGKF